MTNIEWCDRTCNPIRVVGGGHWCRKVSPGCANCYSEKIQSNSFFKGSGLPFAGEPPQMELLTEELRSWARIRTPGRIFISSTTDIFGEWVPRQWQIMMLDAMTNAPMQTFQLLTKRPKIMLDACRDWMRMRELAEMPSNIWLGTSVENQQAVSDRIPYLGAIQCSVRFVSAEPLLENIRLDGLELLHWVIIGGESGTKARPFQLEWGLSIIEQCQAYSVPVFFKQTGQNAYLGDKRKRFTGKGGVFQELPSSLQVREFPRFEVGAIAG